MTAKSPQVSDGEERESITLPRKGRSKSLLRSSTEVTRHHSLTTPPPAHRIHPNHFNPNAPVTGDTTSKSRDSSTSPVAGGGVTGVAIGQERLSQTEDGLSSGKVSHASLSQNSNSETTSRRVSIVLKSGM